MKDMDCNTKGHWIAFWICLLAAIFLMIGGAITPPPFEVDASIFKCVGWLFGFAALSQFPSIVQSGMKAIFRHGNTSLTVGGKSTDEEKDEEKES